MPGILPDWRRGRDSNPRYHLWYTPLAGERLQPLGHLSGIGFSKDFGGFGNPKLAVSRSNL